ncbi:2-oxoacid:acceptor oxidoreductase family protein [Selenihalanaerobacter shriftii]|uniref:2-oxoglutarate ferredoxin oxidoreductase subunit gamma n=1 Tax=Selenihalanaerobacter shriftii TaxID=142842 RepID=A0A1T4R6P5_9FIRM|nr:2-oxoacid:acceptor oxidoreductase family protein [Selenihalanaerobacter shriftii]SKA11615.1 2-oxoglutarate ferredoxin oxidoreductase subunit gamma [Selenihalanaerobacter shriftii]
MPSYGPEMRGGTANCTVIVSQERIASPVVSSPSTAVVMNRPSLDKFEDQVQEGGNLFINTSLISKESDRDDINVIEVPANEIANELGNSKVANMVMLGAFITQTGVIDFDSVMEALENVLPEHRHNLLPLNEKALQRGKEVVEG